LLKDNNDSPVPDASGNYKYAQLGEIKNTITNGLSNHWNRTTMQVGFDYDRTFGKHTFTGMLLGRRHQYTYNGLIYEIRSQGLSANVVYDYDQRFIVDLSAAYTGSADFEKGKRYGLFPALGLGWIISNESFLENSQAISFLKLRGSAGLTGNNNADFRFLYEQWAASNSGWMLTTSNTWVTGRREGAIPNLDFTWEQKASVNFGIDATFFDKLSVNIDVFSEKRTGILENATAKVPDYTGFRLANMNTGAVKNFGFESVIGYNTRLGNFDFYTKALISFARNTIVERSEIDQPYAWLYQKGYRINQQRGFVSDGFYQLIDFTNEGLLRDGFLVSTLANDKPVDLK
jgi:hypothetical protein